MNWDEIENSWAAMTRRVRPDWPDFGKADEALPPEPEDADGMLVSVTDAPDPGATTEPASEPLRIA